MNDLGFRLSKQRRVILEELRKVTSHPTADEVYDMVRKVIPKVSLGTVYRNLEFLSTQGLVLKLGGPGEQKRFDGNPMPHPHIRCLACSKIDDVHVMVDVPEITSEQAMGYEIKGVSLEYLGICPRCASEKQ